MNETGENSVCLELNLNLALCYRQRHTLIGGMETGEEEERKEEF